VDVSATKYNVVKTYITVETCRL